MSVRDKYLTEAEAKGTWQPSPNLGLGLLAMMKNHISSLRTYTINDVKELGDHFAYLAKYSDKDSAKKFTDASKLMYQAIDKIKEI